MSPYIFAQDKKFLMLALDHLGSFKKIINSDNPEQVTSEQIISLKTELITSLSTLFSGVLIDSDFGLPAYNSLNTQKPFMLRCEKSDYEEKEGERITTIEYSAKELKKQGSVGAKMLMYFDPYGKYCNENINIAKEYLEQCKAEQLPFFLEIVTYSAVNKDFETAEYVPKSLQMFIEQQVIPDVWKLEYPGDIVSCFKVKEIVKNTPWILLTRGGSFETFSAHLKDAVKANCSGFLAGRALWQDINTFTNTEREDFLNIELPKRFKLISQIVNN